MHRNRLAAAAAIAGLLGVSGLANSAAAQSTANASVDAVAFVIGVAPLTAAGVRDLTFGNVTAGTIRTITDPAADGGRFAISGEPSTPVTVSFTLPPVITSAGGDAIPITFGGTDGIHWTTFPSAFLTFNPHGSFLVSLSATGNLVIGIIGSIAPPLGTVTGEYRGTIQLTVAY
jgi:hypothetical protein